MKSRPGSSDFKPQEKQVSVLPAGAASILLLLAMVLSSILNRATDPFQETVLIAYCILNSSYLAYFHFILIPSPKLRPVHIWTFAILQVIAFTVVSALLPNRIDNFLSGLMVLLAITISIIYQRKVAYFIIIGMALSFLVLKISQMGKPDEFLALISTVFIAVVSVETILQLRNVTRRNINRLEIINEFSRQITSSLNTRQVFTLLSATIQNALEADSYFVGILDGDKINLVEFYDDGEYFTDISTSTKGTLSGWVVKNQKELFLPDLRHDLHLDGVENVIIGKEKTSLSWMGVPLRGTSINGLIAIASYHPNAFDRPDLELLNNMARHAVFALDNAIQHGEVEKRSRLDSLTGVYNHGYFLKLLAELAKDSLLTQNLLSLIMLDVDYFKNYNDTYGHLAGDDILTLLCDTIRKHIKQTDAVGRWGGEEFVIALPGASGKQANQVAERIHRSMNTLKIKGRGQREIPAATLSQGIAQFPDEANDIIKLIDLADQRLYIAKERGRNQIEPAESHWD